MVVPTRDRPEALGRCLAALALQDLGDLDVVVVDDGSRDRAAVTAAVAILPTARVIRAPGRGPAVARNVGAKAARGAVVCFTDDDCEPLPGWAGALAEGASVAAVAAGRTVAPSGASAAICASQTITEHLLLDSLDPASGTLGFAPTCNLAVTRKALARLPFNPDYPTAAAEDRDWSERAVAAGVAPVYVPDAVVVHRQHLDLRAFARQQFRYGQGAARFRRADADRRLAPPRFYAALARRGFARGRAVGALVLAAQAATLAGAVSERGPAST